MHRASRDARQREAEVSKIEIQTISRDRVMTDPNIILVNRVPGGLCFQQKRESVRRPRREGQVQNRACGLDGIAFSSCDERRVGRPMTVIRTEVRY